MLEDVYNRALCLARGERLFKSDDRYMFRSGSSKKAIIM